MDNAGVAALLYELADYSELSGEVWEPRAYRRAARQIELMGEDVNRVKDLDSIPGVGEGIAKKIREFLDTGKSSYLEALKRKTPVDYENLSKVNGLGPKRVKVLYEKLGVKNLADLKKALESGKVGELDGFADKLVKDLLEGLSLASKSAKEFLLGDVYDLVQSIKKDLLKVRGVTRVEVCGSVRRMVEVVHDADLLACSSNPAPVMDYFTSMKGVRKVLAKGETKSSIILDNGFQVDLRVVALKSFGAALNYFIGSKAHNIALRRIAISKGLKLSEYGLFSGEKLVAGKSEEELYNSLGLNYVEPEMRENLGELELSISNKLPKLVSAVKGDLQMHSKFSDGANTVSEMVSECERLGYDYCGVSDHAGNLRVANAMNVLRVREYLDELSSFKVLKGVEVDILSDGSLSLPDKLLGEFDYVIASIHSGFKQSPEVITSRLLKAFDSRVSILAHPTGRLINKRQGFSFDFDKVFSKAAELGVILEIDAQPERLDLSPEMVRRAKVFGNKFIIDSDAHSAGQLGFMKFGLGVARRAWLSSREVINSLPVSRLKKFLR